MSQNVPPDPELTAIEAALGSLTPSRSRLDRDRLMFLAGQRSRPSLARKASRWAWPAIAASLAALATAEGAALALRPVHTVVQYVNVERPSAPAEPPIVVILSQEPPEAPRPRSSANRLGLQSRQLWLRGQVAEGSLDRASELTPVALDSTGSPFGAKSQPSGILLRSEIAELLNPGEPL